MRPLMSAPFAAALLLVTVASAADRVSVQPNQVVIQVNGIVCSFCARGAEKALGKLDCLDGSAFGDDGVLVDIDKQRVVLALRAKQKVPVADIYKRIRSAGYDPVALHLRLSGNVTDGVLTTTAGQKFALSGSVAKGLQSRVELQGHIDAKDMEKAAKSTPKLVVDRMF